VNVGLISDRHHLRYFALCTGPDGEWPDAARDVAHALAGALAPVVASTERPLHWLLEIETVDDLPPAVRSALASARRIEWALPSLCVAGRRMSAGP